MPICTGVVTLLINIALPSGRLGQDVYDIFESCGYGCPEIREDSRKLVFENADAGVRYFWVKPADTAMYVERGVADIGVAGYDILLEYAPDVYELLDLGVGKCRVAVAAKAGFRDTRRGELRVAEKFVNIARGFYAKQNRDVDIIELHGSVELAPLLGLSDVIVDLVSTGKTLRDNGMEELETIADVSARLIANKVGYKFKYDEISRLCDAMKAKLP